MSNQRQHDAKRPRLPAMGPLLALMLLCSFSGCAWYRNWANAPQAPAAFTATPTIEQIAQHLNNNPVRQLEAERARISVDGLPSLSARLALERPRNLRFRVETALTGPELDMGSNYEMFWIWAKRNEAVLYARHDRFAASPTRQAIPVQPEWIGEALGLVYLDPYGQHEGPYNRGDHRLEIRSRIPSPGGDVTRVLIVNDVYGWILEQHLYDVRGQLIASARSSNHRYYQTEGVSLPHRTEIQLPSAQMAFTLDVAQYRINALSASPEQLFAMPQFGDPMVDVADPSFLPPQAATASRTVSRANNEPQNGFRPRLRGLGRMR